MPEALTRVFFSDSGSTSVEVALKMALGFWANRGEPRHRILVMENSYHGDTIGAMSVGARGVFNAPYDPLLFDVVTLPFPSGDGARTLEALRAACSERPAALIIEPLVLGAGGMLFYDTAVLAAMRTICADADVLFIADEVMTGWGRTGSLLACEQAGIVPDILCLSKGLTGGSLPLAATMAIEPIYEAHLSRDRARMFFHSSSYTANPLACAAAAANLEIWRDEPVLERIADLSRRQADRMVSVSSEPAVRNARTLGTIAAFEIGSPEGYLSDLGPRLLSFFRERDVLLRPLGNTVYVMPPFCISEMDLDLVYGAILDAIRPT
jgi:adenosylmethionine-8-amino-7-oxononanoate aminotransferase